MKVSVILDREFSPDHFEELGDAFWLVGSPHNRALVQSLWATGRFDPNSAVFNDDPEWPLVDRAADIFPTVIEHHPNWREIELIGIATLPPAARQRFSEVAPLQIDELGAGRIALSRID